MAPHSSTLAWKIPWMEEPGRLQSMGSLGVGPDWATSLSLIGEGNGNPLQCSSLENPRDGGAWWAAVYGVTQSRTRLKWLSSSSSSSTETYILPSEKLIAGRNLLYDVGGSNPVLCEYLECWDELGGGRKFQEGGEHMYIYDWFMLMYGKNHHSIVK